MSTQDGPNPRRSIGRRLWRIVRATFIVCVIVGVGVTAGVYVYLRQSLPITSGTVRVSGLTAPVDIVRDHDAVPHISASTTANALFALGYAHAQDRLWQMEMQRRAARGRMSEIFGSPTIAADHFMRTLGLLPAAQKAWQAYPADARAWIQAYIAGINTFIATSPSRRLPPELKLLYLSIDPWTPEDVLVVGKLLAFNLSGNLAAETLGDDVTRAIGAERAAELLPPSPNSDLTIVADTGSTPHGMPPAIATKRATARPSRAHTADPVIDQSWQAAAALFGILNVQSGIGSNSWVVGGSRTTTGMPMLANDVHLEAQLPSTWYVAHLTAADGLNVAGATVPGLPGVIIGRTDAIAWGVTNLYADTQDLFREQLDASGTSAMFQGAPRPLEIRKEMIQVRRGEPVEHVTRLTAHGPILSDAGGSWKERTKGGTAIALQWTALDPNDESLAAMLRVNRARNWDEFRTALGRFAAPALSFIYADRDGNIGFYAAGRLPIRRSGDGTGPVDGASGAYDWIGSVPPEQAPQLHNPPNGIIVTANNRAVPIDFPYVLGRAWEKPYRAERITQLLDSLPKISREDMAAFQQDTVSLESRELLPEMLRLAKPRNAAQAAAVERLQKWNGNMAGDSVAATLYAAWTRKLLAGIVTKGLGPRLTSRYVLWSDLFGSRFLAATLKQSPATWCGPGESEGSAGADCGGTVLAALDAALAEVRTTLGEKDEAWRWDAIHHVAFTHQPLGFVPGVAWFFNRNMPSAGGIATVNVGSFDAKFTQHVVASYRQVSDLGSSDHDRYILAGGQSGHFLSSRYADLLDDWRSGRYRPLRLTAPADDARPARLRLTP
jgi:penicillin amidase